MSESDILQKLKACLHQVPVPSKETHLPIDLHLQRFMVPARDNRPVYHIEAGELIALNLSGLGLDDTIFTHLKQFPHLRALNLMDNSLQKINFPETLAQIEYLDLSNMQALRELHFSSLLTRLKRLDISASGLETLTFCDGFSSLEIVQLQGNKLSTLELPSGLTSLRYLDLKGNQLQSFASRGECPALWTLYLDENKLSKLHKDFLTPFPNLGRLRLEGNPLQSILRNISEDSAKTLAAIQRYTVDLEGGTDLDRECKVLLLGNGNVGKSCLVKRLVYNKFEKEWHSTHAISLEQFPPADKSVVANTPAPEEAWKTVDPYLLNLWDFGGQDIYHATHRLFMQENAVYLLLWDVKTESEDFTYRKEQREERKYENHKLKYWLSYAKSLGKNSPVIVVQTKTGKDQKQEPPGNVRNEFTPVFSRLEFLHVESAEEDWKTNGDNRLIREIRDAVQDIKKNDELATYWATIRQEIRNLQKTGKKRLELIDFYQLAKAVVEPMDVLDWLTQSGVVFYKQGLFNDEIILDQGWAIEKVYTLFDRENIYYSFLERENGTFSGKDLEKCWKENSEAERELFVSFMLSCELCFETTQEDKERYHTPFAARTFIAPQLLPPKEDSHELIWKGKETLYIRLEHEFLHYGVIQSFIVRVQKWGNFRKIWKTGILLEDETQMAQVEAGKDVVMVKVTRGSEKLLAKIRRELADVQGDKVTVLAGYDGENFAPLSDIEELLTRGNNQEIKCTNGQFIPIAGFRPFFSKMLHLHKKEDVFVEGMLPSDSKEVDEKPPERKPFVMPEKGLPKVYFSYAWGDPDDTGQSKEDLVTAMYEALETEKNYQLLRDKKDINYGDLISAFMKALGEGDLIVVFISDKYIRSEYCMYELYEIARNSNFDREKFRKRILPVRVESLALNDIDILEEYYGHWEKECSKWKDFIKRRIDRGNISEAQSKRLIIYTNIEQKLGDLIDWLQDINASTYKLLSQDDYKIVKEAIEKRLSGEQ
ncbi:MAG: COR domain-containing protein [Bacteroidia bacterium]|nr:COR domain-containing protein [Bacteroidia bacterium]